MLLAARQGTFNDEAFLGLGRRAIARYVARASSTLKKVFPGDADVALLFEQKLISLANPLMQKVAPLSPPRLNPSQGVKDLFGRGAYSVLLTPVRGAKLLRGGEGSAGASRYAWRVSTSDDAKSGSSGTARTEFGRAVFVEDVDVDPRTGAVLPARARRRTDHIRTQVVVKGVGPTRYAGNRFSLRTSGVLTLLQGDRDWRHSEALARGGVPVYRPLELALLPYCDWHPHMGWRPMVTYARLPLENLRVSDLEVLPRSAAREAIAELRSKLAVLAGVPAEAITEADVVRFFVTRLGRIAGLCEAGRTFEGRPFFHGFLHPQNVSLLGELVDLGEGRFVRGQRELRAAYARSGYVNPARNWSVSIRRARREAALYHQLSRLFTRLVTPLMNPRPARPPRGLDALFWRAHGEGRAGLPADCAQKLLRATRVRGAL